MALSCRICKNRFDVTKFLNDCAAESSGFSVVATQCGHLFHKKCLEGALTNQKLLHARHGRGPLRRFCPVIGCSASIPSEDSSVISISFSDGSVTDDVTTECSSQDNEGKLLRRMQSLTAEKDKLAENLAKSDTEVEILRSALEQIKFDLSDIQSFLRNDHQMKKGDLIFWVTRDGTYAPGKILEIRKKPGENVPYAIVKLDNKTKVPGVGPHAVNRDTLIVPVSELITFKSFFNNFFHKFQASFEAVRLDFNREIQNISSPTGSQGSNDRSTAYYRSTRKISRPVSKSRIGGPTLNPLTELDSVEVDSVAVPVANPKSNTTHAAGKTAITRSRTIHYGADNEARPRRMEKCRSLSWVVPPTTLGLDSPTASESSSKLDEQDSDEILSGINSPDILYFPEQVYHGLLEDDEADETVNEFIKDGERVIWFDSYSEFQQLGTVAAVCEFSPCAIVKFDEHPNVKHKFQYRTVPLAELFPYNLVSPEEKLKIAECYGTVEDFLDTHKHMFTLSNEESSSELLEYDKIPEQ